MSSAQAAPLLPAPLPDRHEGHMACTALPTSPAVTIVRSYLETSMRAGGCLILSGPTGVGKSWAAMAGLRAPELRDKHFFYFPSLCRALLDADRNRRAQTLEVAKTSRFSVWDDFGAEDAKVSGWVNSLIDELVWHREAERLPTIITTNLTRDQLRDRLSDRIVDRLAGDWGRIFHIPGESLRRGDGGNG